MFTTMIAHARYLLLFAIISVLGACGGGGGGDSSTTPLIPIPDITPRENNPSIPAEHAGTEVDNSRYYQGNRTGYKVSVLTTGLTGPVTLKLADEQVDITENTTTVFNSTFVADTFITVDIIEQPYLQTCSFTGGVNSGIIMVDATLQLQLNCVDSNVPAAPFIEKIYSTTTTTMDLEWQAAVDRDTNASLISYTVYWSTDRTAVENKSASSQNLPAATLVTQLTGLTADTEYFIAVEATDNNGNQSGLSDIRSLKTIATENVLSGTPYFVLDQADVTISGTTWTVPETAFGSAPVTGNVLITVTVSEYHLVKIVSAALNTGIYTFTVENGSLGDVFETLSFNSDFGFNESPQFVEMGIPKPYPWTSFKSFTSPYSISLCRQETTADDNLLSTQPELTPELLDMIKIKPYRKFQPSLLNELKFSGGITNPTLTGSIGFRGEIQLGVEVGFDVTANLEGVYSCKLAGMPLSKGFTIPVYGIPVQADFGLDVELKLVLQATAGVKAKAEALAYLGINDKLTYNSTTNTWDRSKKTDLGYTTNASYEDGVDVNVRASVIPSLFVSMYKGLGPELTLSADTGVSGDIDTVIVSKQDPIFKIYGYPLKLDEFKIEADTKLVLEADLKMFGISFTKLPFELFSSEPLRLFDTPLVCTNEGATQDDCKTEKNITGFGLANRFPLQIHLVDGTFFKSLNAAKNLNKAELNSVDWQVFPNSGYVEVNKNDPTKATFFAYDDGSYTIVASAYGALGEPARKFATFHVGQRCNYGLNQKLPKEYDQYFYTGVGNSFNPITVFPNGANLEENDAYIGYVLPVGLEGAIDTKQGYNEVCSGTVNTFHSIDSSSHTYDITMSFFAGRRNGTTTTHHRSYDSKGVLLADGTGSETYVDGRLISGNDYLFRHINELLPQGYYVALRGGGIVYDYSNYTFRNIQRYNDGSIYRDTTEKFYVDTSIFPSPGEPNYLLPIQTASNRPAGILKETVYFAKNRVVNNPAGLLAYWKDYETNRQKICKLESKTRDDGKAYYGYSCGPIETIP